MRQINLGGIPDGRMRFFGILSDNQRNALRSLKIEGLEMLHVREMEMQRPETWVEYWIDANKVKEDDLRTRIHLTVLDYWSPTPAMKADEAAG